MGEAEALVECKMQNLIVKLNDRRPGRTGPRQSAQQTGAIYRTKSLGVTADICLGPTAITLDVGNLVTATRYEFTESHPFGDWMKQGNAGIVYTFIIHVYVYIYYMLIIQSQFGIPNSCWTYIDPLLIVEHCIGRDLVLGVKNHRTKWWMAWPWPWLPEGKKSMDWLKGKSRGNHRFYHEDHGGFLGSCNFSLKPIHWRIGSKLQVVPGSLMSPVIFHQPRNRCATLR